MDYRPIPDDRTEQFRSYLRYAFEPERGPREDADEDEEDRPGDPRGLFDGDDLLCVCRHHWFRARQRGRWTEMPGLSAVASPPEHRRKGHVARLLAASLEEYRDRGDYLTALWAFEHPFYERQGWGLANKYAEYECSPDALAFARREATRISDSERPAGEFRRVEADDWAALDSVLAAHDERFDLAIDRTEEWWRTRVFESWRSDPYVYAWDDETGETRGYVVYRVEDEAGGKKLAAAELAHADREARLNLLRFLANHDSQVETVRVYGTDDARLLDEVADPAAVDCEIKPGPMVRLVDVPAAIEALEYPGADGRFDLAVSDPLADWNDRRFRVEIEDGRATCEMVDSEDADAEVGVATLSQLYVGYHSVADAEAFGDLDVRSSAARETLEAMFPPREVFLPENF
ncbi:GNAT family N-acetyltransferase [Halorussus amylolyticus]|uniref:GNAT family N-acetyltransferase n=1 Tax=Halorussus amylolyticus TaxID=1126242 RepID=UPI001051C007|nr:GNAT family N-acetyltransferase [Halorussus amylolyticus]